MPSGQTPYSTNESRNAIVTGANTRKTFLQPPSRQASTSQKMATANPVWGLTVTKNKPMVGGREKPNKGSHSIFALRVECITGGERTNRAIVRGVAPRR